MEHNFWHQRWSEGRIGFHQQEINFYLKSYWEQLELEDGGKVFVPLCGKSLDLLWLRGLGHKVIGVELNASACEAFFSENKMAPITRNLAGFVSREVDSVQLLCGDYFDLRRHDLFGVQAVYDRAALIALPPEMRRRYVRYLIELLPVGVKMLLVTLEFEGGEGPPFSVKGDEVEKLYGENFEISCLSRVQPDDPRDVGRIEVTWLLVDKRV
ncbi:MAG: thiopurine S-methyltransferase [Neptuniibacter sp.]